jgi:hypothetical protein
MNRRYRYLLTILIALSVGVLAYIRYDKEIALPVPIDKSRSINRPAGIYPDYSGTVIPPNIAPLNFMIQEDGSHYYVKIYSKEGPQIEVVTRSPKILIPKDPWHQLLKVNSGQELHFDVLVLQEKERWNRFDTITNTVAPDRIDGFLVYRNIRPLHNNWTEMGIYQRDLETYDKSLVLHSRSFRYGCVHCHGFLDNDTNNMFMHVRAAKGPSMLLIQNGQVTNLDSRTPFGSAPMGHPAWHPSGKVITFTVYKVRQFFHTAKSEMREALDTESALGYYLLDSKTIKTSPVISRKDRLETFPTWSPDGRYLYFCSAPIWWSDHNTVPDRYDQIKYDLVRVRYDLETDTWGQQEMVLSAKQTGQSVVQPRISPDGRFLLFCMCEYSCFPTFQPNSDLYLMDLSTGRYEPLACNSEQAESWHSWSSNGRWIVFSSKRRDILFNRVYFSYIDENGTAHKPFLLPQKDPAFYDSFMRLYQLPELAKSPIPVKGKTLARLIRSSARPLTQIPITSATPKAASPPSYGKPWQAGHE